MLRESTAMQIGKEKVIQRQITQGSEKSQDDPPKWSQHFQFMVVIAR